MTVRPGAFGTAGFGYPRVESMHASPSETGNHTEPLTVVDCSVLENLPPPPPQPDQSVKSEKSAKSAQSTKGD